MGAHNDPTAQYASRIAHAYETLTADRVQNLAALYAADAVFQDPFQRVQGREPIARIMQHMFTALHAPRFEVQETVASDGRAFLCWHFHFALRAGGRPRMIEGGTWLRFNVDGQVCVHTDYWDTSTPIFEQIPLLASVVRWVKGRLRSVP